MSKVLLVIDPQNDFMDSPDFNGALAVPGAHQDMLRLSKYISSQMPDAIFVTMDTHAVYDIAHAAWWVDSQGNSPNPFTIISPEDVESGKWKASDSAEQEYSEYYVKELASQGKYPLCIWPNHCIKGSKGHELEATFAQAVKDWENKTGKEVQYLYKGMNPKTEHYSGLKAEVQLMDDELTQLNTSIISQLDTFDNIVVAGEAQSHCVFSTTMDLLDNIASPSKVTLLTDCMSSVPGFESAGENFLSVAGARGASLEKSQKVNLKP